jgi:hypothetical protein
MRARLPKPFGHRVEIGHVPGQPGKAQQHGPRALVAIGQPQTVGGAKEARRGIVCGRLGARRRQGGDGRQIAQQVFGAPGQPVDRGAGAVHPGGSKPIPCRGCRVPAIRRHEKNRFGCGAEMGADQVIDPRVGLENAHRLDRQNRVEMPADPGRGDRGIQHVGRSVRQDRGLKPCAPERGKDGRHLGIGGKAVVKRQKSVPQIGVPVEPRSRERPVQRLGRDRPEIGMCPGQGTNPAVLQLLRTPIGRNPRPAGGEILSARFGRHSPRRRIDIEKRAIGIENAQRDRHANLPRAVDCHSLDGVGRRKWLQVPADGGSDASDKRNTRLARPVPPGRAISRTGLLSSACQLRHKLHDAGNRAGG